MSKTKIEWTSKTWNPTTGCTKISPGCKNCYAASMALRLQKMNLDDYRNGFALTEQPHRLNHPMLWKRPSLVFVNSMSDLFHENLTMEYILRVFDVMRIARQHQFQILTKRADRLMKLSPSMIWPGNIWAGVSVENSESRWRINCLRKVPAAVRFLSCEPLLGPLPNLDLEGIDWVIVGGESGSGFRPMNLDWARAVRDQCAIAGVPFFFKQHAAYQPKKLGRLLDGVLHDVYPIPRSAAVN